jgi:AAA15 family ATPase/GTPase
MQLATFQVTNCFGFRDSGKVILKDANNFIYLLGRNSSGKSSFLNAIKYFEIGIKPNEQQNFQNFNDTGSASRLSAEFTLNESGFSFDTFIKNFFEKYPYFTDSSLSYNQQLNALVELIKNYYQQLIADLNKEGVSRIEKTAMGHYLFSQYSPFDKFNARRDTIQQQLKKTIDQNGNVNIDGTLRSVSISFEGIEDVLFRQTPRIFLFNERYSLKEVLPERITHETLTGTQSKFLEAFLSYLNVETLERFLDSNDPDERDELRANFQQRVNQLTEKVNQHRGNNNDLLEIRLHEKNGLQITVLTDGKKSYYSHISDNTKFLFAYFMYHEKENIKGDILLFDEPSNGFHPTAQEFILNFLQSLTKNHNLVVVATHSEYLIDINMLAGVRLMGVDDKKYLVVKNHFYNQPKEKGDYLALQPIFDAIGYNYGRQINIKDKLIVTEGVTDMLYLRAFNTLLRHDGELNIAPTRGDSHILTLIPLLISQAISFKVIIDTGNIKKEIKDSYGVDDVFIWEVPIPSEYIGKMKGSGIEDLFTKEDFKNLLLEIGEPIEASYEHVSNSEYIKNRKAKRFAAHYLYENVNQYDLSRFETQTIENFRNVLDFCKEDKWFDI